MVGRNRGARIPITIIPPHRLRSPQRLRSASCAISEHMNVVNTMSMTPMLYPLEAGHGGSKNSARVGTSIERCGDWADVKARLARYRPRGLPARGAVDPWSLQHRHHVRAIQMRVLTARAASSSILGVPSMTRIALRHVIDRIACAKSSADLPRSIPSRGTPL